MPRKKSLNRSDLFTRPIRTRVTESVYQRLYGFVDKGDCHSIGEVARRVLSQERILYTTRDGSADFLVEELMAIRKELRAIGVNINQITHWFHVATKADQRLFHALKVAEKYDLVGQQVEVLLSKVAFISSKWLQK